MPKQQALEIGLPDIGALPAGSDTQTLHVSAFSISGNTVVSTSELTTLLDDLRGKTLTLAQLQQGVMRITQRYRALGYPLARAWLPQQEIQDGQVRVEVLEGRYGDIRIDNQAQLRNTTLQPLHTLQQGDVVEAASLERSLLLARELAGVATRATLQPGASVGTTDLVVDVLPTARVNGSLELDNFGNFYTGQYRLTGTVNLNNMLGLGDQFNLRLLTTDDHQRYGRLGWQGSFGRAGTRVGAAYSSMRYALGRNFAILDASGNADIASVWAMQPLKRSRDLSISLGMQFDSKKLRDEIALVHSLNKKRVEVVALTLSGYGSDDWLGGAMSSASVSWNGGRLRLLDPITHLLDAYTARTAGRYQRLNANVARLQRLGGQFSLLVQAEGQFADGNLDSSEKMPLGGVYGVRAYPQGEAAGDQGWLARVELRRDMRPGFQLSLFYDQGGMRLNHKPWAAGINHRMLAGAGLGMGWTHPQWQASLGVAWQTDGGTTESAPEKTPRLWGQVVRRF